MKKVFIGLGITIGVLVGGFLIGTVTSQNKAISLEELVSVTSSDIEIQEKRRVDLINNLVDTVKEYDKHEAETLEKVIDKRGKQGSVTDATNVISGIAEAYPQLKSDANYRQLMTELSTTENLISEHRKTYNGAVKNYNVISGIAEAYPQLKSDANYRQLMTELSTTENLISEHRKTYNGAVKNYNRYVRRFPARMFLNITSYEKQNFDYLEFNASSDAPTDLFGDKNE